MPTAWQITDSSRQRHGDGPRRLRMGVDQGLDLVCGPSLRRLRVGGAAPQAFSDASG
ncbi:MAG: hypothetical protein VKK97_05265 [Synechococcaceae cyanobacterium]|nr:hypothetical protein [Synechococcaceae cyanobacterium]